MFSTTSTALLGAICATLLTPLAAAADCIRASDSVEGAFNGEGTFTSAEGFELGVEATEYTPHADNALGFVASGMGATECHGAGEGFGLKSAALRLNFTGEVPVTSVSIAYCVSYPILNISAGSESPPAYHENWKRNPIPGEIADDAGNMVTVVNAPVWNGDIYLDEAMLTLSSQAGLETMVIGMREGFITEICMN